MHVSALASIWTYFSVYLKGGCDLKAIWIYVYTCLSAGEHMVLHLFMFERRRRYGVTFLHIAAPAVIWTYVSACLSVAGEVDEANVAVARVSCTLRSPRREKQRLPFSAELESCAHFAQRELEKTRKTECLRIWISDPR